MASTTGQDLRQDLQSMDEYQFEALVADVWMANNWQTKVTTATKDGGIDVIAKRHDPFEQTLAIQVKRYADGNLVGSPEVQQYASVKHQNPEVDMTSIITTSNFSNTARSTAKDLNVKLVNGEEFVNLLAELDDNELLQKYNLLETEDSTDTNEPGDTQSSQTIGGDELKNEDFWRKEEAESLGIGAHIGIFILTFWSFGLVNILLEKLNQDMQKEYRDEIPPSRKLYDKYGPCPECQSPYYLNYTDASEITCMNCNQVFTIVSTNPGLLEPSGPNVSPWNE